MERRTAPRRRSFAPRFAGSRPPRFDAVEPEDEPQEAAARSRPPRAAPPIRLRRDSGAGGQRRRHAAHRLLRPRRKEEVRRALRGPDAGVRTAPAGGSRREIGPAAPPGSRLHGPDGWLLAPTAAVAAGALVVFSRPRASRRREPSRPRSTWRAASPRAAGSRHPAARPRDTGARARARRSCADAPPPARRADAGERDVLGDGAARTSPSSSRPPTASRSCCAPRERWRRRTPAGAGRPIGRGVGGRRALDELGGRAVARSRRGSDRRSAPAATRSAEKSPRSSPATSRTGLRRQVSPRPGAVNAAQLESAGIAAFEHLGPPELHEMRRRALRELPPRRRRRRPMIAMILRRSPG